MNRVFLLVVASFLSALPAAANPAPTATTLAIIAAGSTVTTIPSGTAVTLTATVTAGSTAVTTGQVNFCDATAASCLDIHLLATAQITPAGTATTKLLPAIGNHSYKAVFAGTKSYATSAAAASNLTVTNTNVTYPTTTTLASSGSIGNYSLNATIVGSGTFTSPAPTGTVSFLDTNNGNAVIGTAELGAGTPQLSFTSPSSPQAGGSPGPIVSADLNGDGKPDLAVYDESTSQVTTLLGNGDGTFTAAAPLAVPPEFETGTGDFNADGKMDLIVAGSTNETDGFVSVFLGNGDGTFATAKTYALTGALPNYIAIGDLNQAGIPDVAVLTTSGNSITILLGNGDGTFTASASQPVAPSGGSYLAISDFNGDGQADLAVIAMTSSGTPPNQLDSFTATVLLGSGDGAFTAATTSSSLCCDATSVVVGDFNGDGKADLAIGYTSYRGFSPTGATLALILGNGDGTFAANPQQFNFTSYYAPGSLSLGDFNGDGNADLAVASSGIAQVSNPSIVLGNGSGAFSPASFAGAYTGGRMAVADFTGDGISGIALTSESLTTVTVLLPQQQQTSSATATGISPVGSGTHQIVASYPGDSTYSASLSQSAGLVAVPTASITFNIPNHTYGDTPFMVAASSASTGAFTYSVTSGPATISGSTVTLTGTGTVTLQASQAAAGSYAASSKLASFLVNQGILTISANSAARVYGAPNPAFTGTITGAVHGDTFIESFTTPANAASIVGTYPIVPSVSGTNLADYVVGATDGTLTVSQAGTVTTFALSNGNNTLTANVASLTTGSPTGTVGFYEGQTLVGTGTLSNGVASYTTTSFPSGNFVVSAQYSGDANFTQSASPPILVLTLAPGNASITVPATGSVTDTVSITPAPGYTGSVQLSCAGLPTAATCAYQPATVAFTASSGKTNVSVTIETGVTTQAAVPAQNGSLATQIAAVFWAPGLLATMLGGRRRKLGNRGSLALVALLCGMLACLLACGGGSSMTSPGNPTSPAGTYNVQITATGPNNLSQSTTISLVVQ